jgi:hypothetical protein
LPQRRAAAAADTAIHNIQHQPRESPPRSNNRRSKIPVTADKVGAAVIREQQRLSIQQSTGAVIPPLIRKKPTRMMQQGASTSAASAAPPPDSPSPDSPPPGTSASYQPPSKEDAIVIEFWNHLPPPLQIKFNQLRGARLISQFHMKELARAPLTDEEYELMHEVLTVAYRGRPSTTPPGLTQPQQLAQMRQHAMDVMLQIRAEGRLNVGHLRLFILLAHLTGIIKYMEHRYQLFIAKSDAAQWDNYAANEVDHTIAHEKKPAAPRRRNRGNK